MIDDFSIFRMFLILSAGAAVVCFICCIVSIVKNGVWGKCVAPFLLSIVSIPHFLWLVGVSVGTESDVFSTIGILICLLLAAGFVSFLLAGGRQRGQKARRWAGGLGIVFIAGAQLLFIVCLGTVQATANAQQQGNMPVQQEEAYAPEITRQEIETLAAQADVSYKDLLRYPDTYAGEYIIVEVEVYQVLGNGLFDDETYYFGYTDEAGYGWYFDDEYCLLDHRMNGSTKILQNDIIRVYGRVVGTQQFERALTSTPVEIPVVEILYSDLIEE